VAAGEEHDTEMHERVLLTLQDCISTRERLLHVLAAEESPFIDLRLKEVDRS
jgi:hypothetical protein